MFSKIRERLKYFFYRVENDWEIGISNLSIQDYLDKKTPQMVKWFEMPRNVFRADPFGFEYDNEIVIFFEEFHKQKGYATINCMVLDQELNIKKKDVVIDEGFHFSYPYLINHEECVYMLPETCEQNKLMLYKAVSFPFTWEKEKIILNEPCMDSVLLYKENYWWLIYTKVGSTNEPYGLYIRKSKELTGDWENCKEYFIQRNRYNTRGGGSIFSHNDKLYRATQNCTKIYGESVVINQIISFSIDHFSETPITEIAENKKYASAFHTLSECGKYTLMDRRRERLYLKSFSEIRQSLTNKLSK